MNTDPIVIVGMARTPMGSFQGALSPRTAPELGTAAIDAALVRSAVPKEDVDAVIMGCVLPAGLGQAPARQASLGAGLGEDVPCTTVNKMCGSGMEAAIMAHDAISAGSHEIMVAGGMESMSNAPYLLPKVRSGLRLGHGEVKDHMFLDGLEDAYEPGRLMGTFAEDAAQAYQFTRDAQDDYAIESLTRAKRAIETGTFDKEVVSVAVTTRKTRKDVAVDEQPLKADVDRIRQLKPAFAAEGTVTAANSSSISDGAAVLVMMRRSTAEAKGFVPRAVIHGHSVHARKPAQFTSAPVGSIQDLFDKTGWTRGDVDLFEVNEAFAVVPMIAMKALDLPHDRLNVNGGACALGHPIGASGARIVVTLLAALERRGLDRGVASLCIGGGEATAVAIERCH